MVHRSGVETVSTDAVRYVLDGLRDYAAGANVDRADLDGFVEYTRNSADLVEAALNLKIRATTIFVEADPGSAEHIETSSTTSRE